MKINKFMQKFLDKQHNIKIKISQNETENFEKLYDDFKNSSKHIEQEQKRMTQNQNDMKKHFDELTERVNKRFKNL